MKVRPLHDRVLIKRIEEQETVRGGIIIPDTAKEKPQEGEVVGPEPANVWKTARSSLLKSKKAIACCSESIREPKSRLTITSI